MSAFTVTGFTCDLCGHTHTCLGKEGFSLLRYECGELGPHVEAQCFDRRIERIRTGWFAGTSKATKAIEYLKAGKRHGGR